MASCGRSERHGHTHTTDWLRTPGGGTGALAHWGTPGKAPRAVPTQRQQWTKQKRARKARKLARKTEEKSLCRRKMNVRNSPKCTLCCTFLPAYFLVESSIAAFHNGTWRQLSIKFLWHQWMESDESRQLSDGWRQVLNSGVSGFSLK